VKILLVIVATVVALAASGCAPQVDVEAERATIRKFHDECLAAQLTGNIDCFAADGQWLPPNAPPIKGKGVIGELVSQMITDPNFSVSHDIVNIEVSDNGDLAYIHYTYDLTMSDQDGNPVTEQGKAIHILKKEPQAGWKILIDIFNGTPSEIGAGGDDSAGRRADVQAILDFEQTVFDAQIAGDIEAWLSSFTEDAIVMAPNMPALMNKPAIRQWNAPIFEQFDLHEESDFREVEVAGDWGYIRAHWIWTQTPKSGGNSAKYTGNSIWIVRRQPNDSWKITRGIFNYDNPIPGAE